MTLRCTIEIVPFGNESEKKVITTLNIHNMGPTYLADEYEYKVEVTSESGNDIFSVYHFRSLGAETLVNTAIKKYLELKSL